MKWILLPMIFVFVNCQTVPKKHHGKHHPTHKTHSVAKKNMELDENDAAIQAIIDALKEREYQR